MRPKDVPGQDVKELMSEIVAASPLLVVRVQEDRRAKENADKTSPPPRKKPLEKDSDLIK